MPATPQNLRGPCLAGRRVLLALALLGVTAGPVRPESAGTSLGHPGYVVIVGAAHPDAGSTFLWQDGPGPDQVSLVWDEGLLTVPAGLEPETFGPDDLAVPCGPGLAGGGKTGRLEFRPGTYPVSEPLLLTDGEITLYVAGGELEIVGERVRYRITPVKVKDPRAPYLLLAGILLLTLVLLRRARRGFAGGRGR